MLRGRMAQRTARIRVTEKGELRREFISTCSVCVNDNMAMQMLEKLRYRYGPRVAEHAGHVVHAFPTLEELAVATESELREMGFGYR